MGKGTERLVLPPSEDGAVVNTHEIGSGDMTEITDLLKQVIGRLQFLLPGMCLIDPRPV